MIIPLIVISVMMLLVPIFGICLIVYGSNTINYYSIKSDMLWKCNVTTVWADKNNMVTWYIDAEPMLGGDSVPPSRNMDNFFHKGGQRGTLFPPNFAIKGYISTHVKKGWTINQTITEHPVGHVSKCWRYQNLLRQYSWISHLTDSNGLFEIWLGSFQLVIGILVSTTMIYAVHRWCRYEPLITQ